MVNDIHINWENVNAVAYFSLEKQAKNHLPLQQSYAYGRAAGSLGVQVIRGIISLEGKQIGFIQITRRRLFKFYNIALAMRGPVFCIDLSDEQKLAIYQAIYSSFPYKGIFLLMPEEMKVSLPKNKRVFSGYSTILLDLSKNEVELFANLHSKWRNRLRAAERASLKISNIGKKSAQYSWLLEKEAKQRSLIGYQALSPAFVGIFQEYAGKDSVFGLKAEQNGEIVAGMLFLIHGNTATYHIGWSNDEGKKLNSHNLLLWHSMLKLKAQGIKFLDLGGVNTDDGAGIARFKLGSGGELLTLCGTYLVP